MTRLYLDINGTLVRHGEPADGVVPFLASVTEQFDCYWLSSICQGDADDAVSYLARIFPPEALPSLRRVKPTAWGRLKTDAIDFDGDFYWLDDHLSVGEREMLERHGALDRHIRIDHVANPGQLEEVRKFLLLMV